ncbi:MAG TPA: hypothetical protein VFT50_01385 [Baekduia sp.]|nr:hypothetical protein [Baekduia sp.]
MLSVISRMEVALLSGNLRAQPPQLLVVLATLFAHTRSIDSRGSGAVRIVPHRQPLCPCAKRAGNGSDARASSRNPGLAEELDS